jgi:hypothetical protein
VTVSFDLYIINTWDGHGDQWGPDEWEVRIHGGPVLLHTTFSNQDAGTKRQAYPDSYPGGDNTAQTSAAEVTQFGYDTLYTQHTPVAGAVYQMSFTFANDSDSLQLDFQGFGLESNWWDYWLPWHRLKNESWGLDNVKVTIVDINEVLIEYSVNNGQDWNDIDIVANTGSYEWLVPEVTSKECLVRVSDVNDPNIYDVSDDVFTIFKCFGLLATDLNKDCKVNFIDFALFALDWLKQDYQWFEYNGHHYTLTHEHCTWEDAEAEAVVVGGHLVTINDADENAWISEFAKDTYSRGQPVPPPELPTNSNLVWIGYHDKGGWVWVSGEPVTFTSYSASWNSYSGIHAYFHAANHNEPGTWNHNSLHDDPGQEQDHIRGIIEVPW